jgi:two-component system, cell cycle sensor histidine kinase PleC
MTGEHRPLPRAMSLAAHELRTPLSVVGGYLRMLLREQGGPLSEKQRKMLEEAERSCARMAVLVSEMSDLGKLESGQLEIERRPLDLAALVAELASRMHEGSDRGVRLEARGTDRPLHVIGDRTRLEAAIGALLYASLRERGDPGVIVAECSATAGPDAAAIVAISDETSVRELAQAAASGAPFDEWMRGGLGLALPVARRIVEAHGGALWSGHGEGPGTGSALRIPLNDNQV